MSEKIKIGIVGCGFVGGALKTWIEEHNSENCEVYVSDPPKGMNDDLSQVDIVFLQIHVPTEDDGTQDLTLMKELMARETGHRVYYMPEFLTERTHIEDFRRQPMVFPVAGENDVLDLLTRIFKGKQHVVMSSLEAEITKYSHNVFGAYKVTYFNAVYDYCKKMGADWDRVHNGMLLSGYINEMHTVVPGPDGKFGYGGKCFPKDVNAFAKLTEGEPLGKLLAPLHQLNVRFRGFEEHI